MVRKEFYPVKRDLIAGSSLSHLSRPYIKRPHCLSRTTKSVPSQLRLPSHFPTRYPTTFTVNDSISYHPFIEQPNTKKFSVSSSSQFKLRIQKRSEIFNIPLEQGTFVSPFPCFLLF